MERLSRLFVAALLLCSTASFAAATQLQMTPRHGGASIKRRIERRLAPSTNGVDQQPPTAELNRLGRTPRQVVPPIIASPTSISSTEQQQQQQPLLSKAILVSTFAFLNGVADVICQKRHGCFATLMTGNLMQICAHIAEGQILPSLRVASLLLSFMTGVALRQTVHNTRANRAVLPYIAVPLLCAAELLYRFSDWKHLVVIMLAVAGGLVNSFASKATDGTVVFAVTGHLTRLANGAVDGQIPKLSILVVSSFGLGILLTSALYSRMANLPLFALLSIPYGLILVAMNKTKQQQQPPPSSIMSVQVTSTKSQ